MSDFYTHPKYDAWKLDSPDEPDDSELCQCEGCDGYFSEDELFEDLCRDCEASQIAEEEHEEEERSIVKAFCKNCLALTPVDHDTCSLCREPYKL